MNKFTAFLRDESGASAAEYVLILAIVGTVLATAVTGLSGAISDALDAATKVITDNPIS